MISAHKAPLRVLEVLAGASAIAGLTSGALILARSVDPKVFEPSVFYSFAVMFVVFGTSVWVAGEYAQTVRTSGSWWQRARGLSLSEMKALVRWCPTWIVYASISGAALSVVIMLFVGEVHWSPGQPFTDREAIAFTAGLSIFSFLSWPVLGSASRMPGTFGMHYGT